MKQTHIWVLGLLLLVTAGSIYCTKKKAEGPVVPEVPKTLREQYSTSSDKWPAANWFEGIDKKELAALPENPFTNSSTIIELGKVLFFDSRLGNRSNNCASCHVPENYWIDRTPVASGGGNRNTPSMENVWYLDGHLMLDGRARTFAEQITIAIESPHEMNGSIAALPGILNAIPGYRPLFTAAFGDETITSARVLEAIASYSQTISSKETVFDKFIKGNHQALNDQELEGLHIFRTKAGCINCHNGPMFTDLKYHNLGNSLDFQREIDYGRFEFTRLNSDRGKFRTPGLRNAIHTAPYLHNGSVSSLDMMIDLLIEGMPQMNGQRITGSLSPHIQKLDINYAERNALIAFVKALSNDKQVIERPMLPQ